MAFCTGSPEPKASPTMAAATNFSKKTIFTSPQRDQSRGNILHSRPSILGLFERPDLYSNRAGVVRPELAHWRFESHWHCREGIKAAVAHVRRPGNGGMAFGFGNTAIEWIV
ncbi:unnamed protein product [Protopolystoma xenopodis]|uniref:Uncharacterized protein n=1 Tax=Protopolystoma xenopodis TaxID=117903 RepID=A0A3S5AQ64_9PLAT|nr:unnamed protein product [Protopolystoma xenopodis]